MNTRTHYFRDEQDNRTVVVTAQLGDGRYKAYITEGEGTDLDVRGYGSSRIGAIADLVKAIAEAVDA